MPKCKNCAETFPKLAKAHIIPRSFCKLIRGDDKHSTELIIGDRYEYSKIWQSGIYDSEIVCQECEKLFCEVDTHGYKVLSKAPSRREICYDPDGHPCAYLIEEVDNHKLKLFFLSMLWRANASKQIFWEHVRLDYHESIIRSYINGKIAPPHDAYEVFMFHRLNQSYANLIIPPWAQKIHDINFYRFYLPGIMALIKVDKLPLPDIFKPMISNESIPYKLFFFEENNFESSEMRYFEKIKDLMRSRK